MESVTDIVEAVAVASGSKTTAYSYVSMLAFLVYDWLILFDCEVEYVWRSEWSVPKILFIIARYGALFDMPVLVAITTVPYGMPQTCSILFKIVAWSTFLGVSISESILLLRTAAIYSGSKRVVIPLSIVYVVGTVAGAIITGFYLHATLAVGPPVPWLSGCSIMPTTRRIVFQSSYLIILGYELVIVTLTVSRMFGNFYSGAPLMKVIYRDSIGFFLVLFVLTLSAFIAHMLAPPHFFNLLTASARVVHSIVCCRILLNLRRAASQRVGSVAIRSTGLVFATALESETNRADTVQLEEYGVRSGEEDSTYRDFVVGRSS